MTIKDEMKGKENNVNYAGENKLSEEKENLVYKKDFVRRTKEEKANDDMVNHENIRMLTEEIKMQKNCIKDKDNRITKLENYFTFRNKTIASVLPSVVCLLPIYWILSIFNKVIEHRDAILVEEQILVVIGLITTILVPICLWFIGMFLKIF